MWRAQTRSKDPQRRQQKCNAEQQNIVKTDQFQEKLKHRSNSDLKFPKVKQVDVSFFLVQQQKLKSNQKAIAPIFYPIFGQWKYKSVIIKKLGYPERYHNQCLNFNCFSLFLEIVFCIEVILHLIKS